MAGTPTLDPVIMEYVERQIDEILRARGGLTFTAEHADRLDALEASVGVMQGDKSLGRIFNGPLWLSGASVLDGTVTAPKISVTTLEAVQASTGTLNVTGTITLAASYPALTGARITLDAGEIAGYNSSDAKTFSLDVDGSGFIGIGSSKVSWTTAGVVTVPVAAISALTIAEVGSGTFNSNFDAGTGRVRAGTALQRVELTSAGIAAYNTGGTQTFLLDATTGSLSHTGTYTIRSAASGTRIEVTNVGIRGYNGATQTFELLASNGSGFLGSSPQITWGAGSLSIPGGSITAGTVTATQLNVSTLSAISSNMGTITAGSITAGSITASTINSGTMVADRVSGGSLGGSIGLGSADLNVTSTGTITNSDGDTWGANGITLVSAGSFGDAIKWKVAGSDKGSIYATSSALTLKYPSGGEVFLRSGDAALQAGSEFLQVVGGTGIQTGGAIYPGTTGLVQTAAGLDYNSSSARLFNNGGTYWFYVDTSGRTKASGNFFPGNQNTYYLGYNGSSTLRFGGVAVSGSPANWSAGSPTGAGYVVLDFNGTSYRVPVWLNG